MSVSGDLNPCFPAGLACCQDWPASRRLSGNEQQIKAIESAIETRILPHLLIPSGGRHFQSIKTSWKIGSFNTRSCGRPPRGGAVAPPGGCTCAGERCRIHGFFRIFLFPAEADMSSFSIHQKLLGKSVRLILDLAGVLRGEQQQRPLAVAPVREECRLFLRLKIARLLAQRGRGESH
ncbi:hypothetical protein CDAR_62951 [Caerostris darwini]|uniref:Uncharacterized protein n=1 Tax=Caerostris darwini TaxID=1538125 RepID=A0AAV4UFD3_9ARAC|nr:hypothetical protein CDAR_62951 [Caerostris darwini]